MIPLTYPIEAELQRPCSALVRAGRTQLITADLAKYPECRALALAREMSRPSVFVDASAVYIHTGTWILNPLSYRLLPCAPLPGSSARWTTDRRLLEPGHVCTKGGVAVTTPARTIADFVSSQQWELVVLALAAFGTATPPLSEIKAVMGRRFRGQDSTFGLAVLEQMMRNRTWNR